MTSQYFISTIDLPLKGQVLSAPEEFKALVVEFSSADIYKVILDLD
ncbi:hypothetical protein [Ligilactobacillus faecis]|nr:hypothetical protein [Ligilactobacillus faecis]WGN89155.1 hypothetical protein QFX10_08915 [Ligilactobacillus faecis]